MTRLFILTGATRDNPAVDAWFTQDSNGLRSLAKTWFERIRACGDDVEVILHDGHPTACLRDAAFAYVDAFSAHVNVGFYQGSALPDPAGLLQGAGKWMRHVKLRPDQPTDRAALEQLILAAYRDVGA